MNWFETIASNNFISVNKSLIKIFGLNTAVLLSELINQYSYQRQIKKMSNGFFCVSTEKLETNTGLSQHQQEQAINKLTKLGIVERCVFNSLAPQHFRFNKKALWRILQNQYF